VRVAALLAGLTGAALLLGGCAVGPSDRPAVAVRDAPLPPAPLTTAPPSAVPLPPLPPGSTPTIAFDDCTSDTVDSLGATATRQDLRYECGSITVALNPDEPRRRAGTTQLHLLAVGTGPVPLVVVGDVAGEPGSLLAARLANQVPPALLTTFTLVGMDRRGTGSSEAVDCVPAEARARLVSIDPGAAQPDGAQSVLDAANLATRTCVQQIEQLLSLIDSWRASTDLEELRLGLRTDRLNAIAVGDGSRVLSAYLGRFPASAGRLVMDGAPDPTVDAIAANLDLAAGAEHAFDAFAADCAATNCPLNTIAADARLALTTVADRLRSRPVVSTDGISVDAGMLFSAVLAGLADTARWPELAAAVAAAGSGSGPASVDGIVAMVRPVIGGTLDEELAGPARLDAALFTMCNDTTTRVPPDRVGQLAGDWAEQAPLFGALYAQRLLVCSPAPVPSRTVPAPRQAGTPPVLVLGTDGDPLTPPAGTRRMAEALAAGILVNWQGNGHGAFPRTPCVTNAVQSFLVDGTLPTNGTTCPP
jgi:pimeloyl-ACP methyl ester carboxylesterase